MKQWYIIQVIPGNEEKIKTEISRRIEERKMTDFFGDILIPEIKNASTSEDPEKNEQLFPGYMFINMEFNPDTNHLIKTVSRVYKFLGGETPSPMTQSEVDRMLGQIRGDVSVSKKEIFMEEGREVEIKSGAFTGFSGVINAIDDQRQRVTVMVSIFGRLTPVEISFDQIKI